MNEDLVRKMADLMEDEVLEIVKTEIDKGTDPFLILDSARAAMEIVGARFERGEYFLPDLIMAGEILRAVSELVKPHIKYEKGKEKLGKVVIGTVEGDIHDIGKDIVVFMLDVNGYEVYDLGVDVPPSVFVEKIKEVKPQVVGLSGFLTLAFDSMKRTVEEIKKHGLRESVKIMIGGGQIDEKVKEYVGADAYGKDAVAAVTLCRKWIGG
ncbi:MAG: cobalamin-dependent protein [Desulfobacterota bacterium]|nr:cobalamin-dependent protein [Thermodesulfobacteriota bacterium]MDW8001257.1 cobalamin-dependent protein [Deltaproteobacteria bacterium]